MRSLCRKNHVRKIPPFFGGGGSADFIFMGARIFLIIPRNYESVTFGKFWEGGGKDTDGPIGNGNFINSK